MMIKTIILVSCLLMIVSAQDTTITTAPTQAVINTDAPVAVVVPTAPPTLVSIVTAAPTLEPSITVSIPTAVPLPPPTVAPVAFPTMAPTLPPVVAPTTETTTAPTLRPTRAVVVEIPTTAPPTESPVLVTIPVTAAPVFVTVAPTASPTRGPVAAEVTRTDAPSTDNGIVNLPTADNEKEEGDELLSLPVWIGIAVAALVVLGAVVYIMCGGGGRNRRESQRTSTTSQRTPSTLPSQRSKDPHLSHQNEPEVEIQITHDDDISTIGYPTIATRSYRGDQNSLPTVDYDYTRSYGAGQDGSVVSSAAGTMGDTVTPSVTTAVLNRMSDPRASSSSQQFSGSSRELEIVAPSGKLGVVLDASDDPDDPISCPVVHTVKDNSPLIGQLRVGDKLIALDDQDVRGMTAMQVSKLISMKSSNPRRKFTILRPSSS